MSVQYIKPWESMNVSLIKNPNIPTIAFLVIGIAIALIALMFGVISYSNYNTIKNQRTQILNNIKTENILNNQVTVTVTNNDLVQFQFELNHPTVPATSNGSGIYTVLFKKLGSDNITIGNYPFSNVNNLVTISMPFYYANNVMGLLVTSGAPNEYLLSSDWTISAIYRSIDTN